MRSLEELALKELASLFSLVVMTTRAEVCLQVRRKACLLCLAMLTSPCTHGRLGLAAHFTLALHPLAHAASGATTPLHARRWASPSAPCSSCCIATRPIQARAALAAFFGWL